MSSLVFSNSKLSLSLPFPLACEEDDVAHRFLAVKSSASLSTVMEEKGHLFCQVGGVSTESSAGSKSSIDEEGPGRLRSLAAG